MELSKLIELGIAAATKENIPDIQGLKIDNALLEIELEDFKKNIKHYMKNIQIGQYNLLQKGKLSDC